MDIIQQALKVMEDQFNEPQDQISGAQKAKDYCRLQIGMEPEEVFGVMFLNVKNQLIAFEKISRGTISEANVSLRPIVRLIMQHNAARIILTHNHPSGTTTPSGADKEITRHFQKFLKMIDCPIVDHIIVSPKESYSFAEDGIL